MSAPPQAGTHDREQDRLLGAGVFEVMWKVSVERHAVPGTQLMPVSIAVEDQGSLLHKRGLTAARLMHRRVAWASRDSAGGEGVARELGALTGQRRGEDLVAVTLDARRALPALASQHDGHRPVLIQPQQLRELELEPARDPAGDGQRRTRLSALDLREHRRAYSGALGKVSERELHCLAQSSNPIAERAIGGYRPHTRVRYHIH